MQPQVAVPKNFQRPKNIHSYAQYLKYAGQATGILPIQPEADSPTSAPGPSAGTPQTPQQPFLAYMLSLMHCCAFCAPLPATPEAPRKKHISHGGHMHECLRPANCITMFNANLLLHVSICIYMGFWRYLHFFMGPCHPPVCLPHPAGCGTPIMASSEVRVG